MNHSAEGLNIRVLGPVEAVRGARVVELGGRRQREVLAVLLVHRGELVAAGRLIDEVWPESPPASADRTLRSYLSRLRAALGTGASLVAESGGYRLQLPADAVDAERFRAQSVRGAQLLRAGSAAAARDVLRAALELWRGPAFSGVEAPVVLAEAARLQDERLRTLEDCVEAALDLGRHDEVTSELERVLAEHPYRERAWRQLMLALYRCGRQADALDAYRRARAALVGDLGIEPGEELRRLEEEILRGTVAGPPLPAAAPAPFAEPSLPTPVSRFVGRRSELDEVCRLVQQRRLVTLTGVGGAGKSRLGLEVAGRLASAGAPVQLAELAGLRDPAAVAEHVAGALGVSAAGTGSVEEALVESLRAAPALVVLDNCEHLLAACVQLTERLLAGAPGLRVLATSRQPLGVAGEVVFAVPPLSVPPTTDPDDAARSDAVALFLDRAFPRLDGPPDPSALRAISVICRELDGLPLSIELAAARTRAFSLEDIEARLDDRFRFLRIWTQGVAPRHAALRATMDWSYELLDPADRAALRDLSVFANGFTVHAAAAVAGQHDEAVEDVLQRLVDASLVERDGDRPGRYRMLETVRQYAAMRLADDGDEPQARARHARHILRLAEGAAARHESAGEGEAVAELEAEHDDLRAALDWALAAEPATAARLAAALRDFWRLRGYIREGERYLEAALAAPGIPAEARIPLLEGLGHLCLRRSRIDRARSLLEEGLALARQRGDRRAEGRLLHRLAFSWRLQGHDREVSSLQKQATAAFAAAGDDAGIAWTIGTRADQAMYSGRLEEARQLYDEGLGHVRRAGSPAALVVAYAESMGRLALARGDVAEAVRLASEGLSAAERLGDRWHIGLIGVLLARIEHAQGRAREALGLLARAAAELWPLRDAESRSALLVTLAAALSATDDPVRAAVALGAAEGMRAAVALPVPVIERAGLAALEERLAAALPADELRRARETGRRMPEPELAALVEEATGTAAGDTVDRC